MRTIILLTLAILLLFCSRIIAKTLFFDDFEDGIISNKWTLEFGKWEEKDGHLANVESGAKFNYAVPEIPDEYYTKQITIQAKGMITGAPWTRMGVGARLTIREAPEAKDGKPTGYIGYVLSTTENGPSDVKLLNEGVHWVNLNKSVRPQLEEWVWLQLTVTEDEELLAKVWLDGEEELDKPIGKTKEGGRPSGPVGLVGKALEAWGRGGATPVYDEVEIWDKDGPSEWKQAVFPLGKLATTWASIKRVR